MTQLTGKTAIITGAASGIGAAAARLFVSEGANVIGADLNEAGLSALASELGSAFRQMTGDITRRDCLDSLARLAMNSFSRIDIVILNAAMDGPLKPILEIDPNDLENVLRVNVRAVFEGIQVFGRAMQTSGGSITITSSVNGLRAFGNTSPYTTSKMAVLGLARAAANDLAQYGIRVNTVHPGLIDTPMLKRAEEGLAPGEQDTLRRMLSQTVALKRVGSPSEIANTMLFLASDASSYVTGESIVVDGGFTRLLSMQT
ncbi:MAG: SDR family oxidoreductase [Pseudomonadota bacterium]|nr:SDR family oxidoreductase [Pseudomonadota bacterium]